MISMRLARMVELDLSITVYQWASRVRVPLNHRITYTYQISDDMWRNVLFSINAEGKENLEQRITYTYVRSTPYSVYIKRKRKEKESFFFFF